MKARLIVADDHEIVRQGLRELLARTGDLEVVAEADDGVTAEHLARTAAADLLVLDVAMPRRNGLQVLESLRADGIGLPVLFFSMYPAEQYASYTRLAGAQGFVAKSGSARDLLDAARAVLAGKLAFAGAAANDATGPSNPFLLLSAREREVMQGLLAGPKLAEIGAHLGVGIKSVSTYRRRLLDKLDVQSNAELASLAAHWQIR